MKKSKTPKPKTSKPESQNDLIKTSESENFLIVGIGASAGGIQALKSFFENVRADSGSAYVVILHLSPDHDSQLAEVLQAVAQIPVAQVKEKVRVEPNRVYVVPPNQHLEMNDGHIVVSPIRTVEERRAPVDIFFRTLAESHGERAVAVILSGTGANGSMGIKRVKENGGAAFVQNPREAEFSDMPRNSIATDLIDLILNVADIPAQIVAYRNNPVKIEIPAEPEKPPEKEKPKLPPQEQALLSIFTQLRVRTGHDFANYKRATMLRRIERRINVRGLPDITAYAAYLRENPDETHALLKDLLISVTNFFRDKETFAYLENEVLPKLFDGKTSDEQIRVWVAGCATGEEAYSLAMFLAEQTARAEDAPTIQIFATDIDEAAVTKAREGFYTLNDAADVSPERLKRFFTKENDGYRIRRELREMVLFAHHNVIKDAPFSRLDLVTCRNMMIYLNHTAQERVMETFHFSLNAGGYLFLGNSETVDGASNLYAQVSREHHIYQSRQAVPRVGYPVPDASMQMIRFVEQTESEHVPENGQQQNARTPKRMSFDDLHQQLLEEYTPSVVVSEEHDIVHMSESSLRFLQMTGGVPTQNLLKLIRPELRLELRTALYQAAQRQKNVEVPNVKIKIDGREEAVNICVRPVMRQGDAARGFILVLFEAAKQSAGESETLYISDEPVARQLEEELIRSKAQLRSAVEQYEVQAEELKASNEELQAMNEELRSSAEELETGKEELQSLNEELVTVNQELKIKIEEISQTGNHLNNLINSTDIGMIFLDRLFRVDLFTPAAAEIFNLIPADIGRPLTDIAHRLEKTDLLSDAKSVLEKLQSVEREVRTVEGRFFLLRALPYRTKEDKIGGVVFTFYDITERKRASEKVRESEEKYRSLFTSIDEGFCIFQLLYDDEGSAIDWIYTEANPAFEKQTGFVNSVGKHISELQPNLENAWFERFAEVARTGEPVRFVQYSEAMRVWFDVYALRVGAAGENGVSLLFNDITERKQREWKQAFLLKLNDALRFESDAIEIQAVVSESVLDYFGADRCYYCEIENDEVIIRRDASRGDLPSVAGVYSLSEFPLFKAMLNGGVPLVVGDSHATDLIDEELKQLYIQMKILSFINVPVMKENRVVGNFCITQSAPRNWADFETKLMEEIAERTWATVTRAHAEELLRESEERFRAMFEQASVGIVQTTTDGQLIAPNQGFCKIIGYTEAEAKLLNLRDVTHPDDYERELELTRQIIAGEIPGYSIEKRYISKDGGVIWGQMTATLMRDASGEPNYALAVVEDISERKAAEEAVRESEERFRLLIESASDYAIFTLTRDNIINTWNAGAEKVFGWTESEAIGQTGEIIFTPEDRDKGAPEQEITTALKNGRAPDERFHLRKDGSRFYVSGVMTLLKNRDGDVPGFAKIARDMTEIIEAEKTVRDKEILQKLVGAQEDERKRIARDLHDELGQQLTALRLKLDAARKLCEETELCGKIDEIEIIAKSIDNGVDFLAWELRPAALDDLGLVAALDNYVKQWSHHSGVTSELLASGLKKARFAPETETNLYRIVQEALNNTHKHAKAKKVEVVLEKRDGLIALLVEDNGVGFNAKNKKNRLKGLGLTGMKERAALIGGTLEIESAPGKGTTIFVRVPASSVKRRKSDDK